MFAKFKYPIAIDIGNQNLYAAQLKQVGKKFLVRGLVHKELDGEAEGNPDASNGLASLLKEVKKDKQFVGKSVVIHLPAQNVYSFPISFQVGETETLEEAIVRESEKYLLFPIEEAIIDYPSILSSSSDNPNHYSAIITAVRRDYVDRYLLILKQAGLTVEAIDFNASSLIRLHDYLFNLNDNPTILCNIGQTQSLLSVVTKDGILARRNVTWGIQILLRKLMANLQLSDEEDKAKILLKEYGLIHEDRERVNVDKASTRDTTTDDMRRAIFQIITPPVEELIYELDNLVGYVRSAKENPVFEGTYMYGQATSILNLGGYLERRLNMPTSLVNPMTDLALSDPSILPDPSDGAPFALALGLSMRKVPWP